MAKVLIVDDAIFIREILKDLLHKGGYHVVAEAENGEQAISAAAAVQPDVILMDIVMPEKNGIDAAKEILMTMPQVKIIACSTLDQEDFLIRALEAGCCAYLTKPFNKEQVLKTVAEAISL